MACVHEFGIIHNYDEVERYLLDHSWLGYYPQSYDCVQVEDDTLQIVAKKLLFKTTLGSNYNKPYIGLDWYGITIIPPSSLDEFVNILLESKIKNDAEIIELIRILLEARENNKYILHYGI